MLKELSSATVCAAVRGTIHAQHRSVYGRCLQYFTYIPNKCSPTSLFEQSMPLCATVFKTTVRSELLLDDNTFTR